MRDSQRTPSVTGIVTSFCFTVEAVVNVAHSRPSRFHRDPYLPYLLPTYPLFPLPSVRGMGVQFGSFDTICQTAALVICPLLGSDQGIEPTCYSRNVDIAGTLIFQPCEFFSAHQRVASGLRSCQRTSLDQFNLSNMFRPLRRDFDDGHHDLSHPK